MQQEEALARILQEVQPLPARSIALADAVDCFAASDIFAPVSLPLFDNSAMDGYAVVANSCVAGTRLAVIDEQPAGIDRGLSVAPGEAIRIFTGAPVPRGADAIVMQEDTTVAGSEIVINVTVEQGEFVRRRGADVVAGQKILSAGERVRPATIGLLAAQGIADVTVGGEVRVAIISTGDELAAPGAVLQPGQIYESNSSLLRALSEKRGVKVVSVTHCPDRADAIRAALRAGAACDAMIISGGVSVGARDLVKAALAQVGAELQLWRVAVKPGKPFLFGRAGQCAMFGLPGNPVSAFVTFLLFVRPALLRLMGAPDDALSLPSVPARLGADVQNDSERVHYIRGVIAAGIFTPFGRQESHALFGLSRSNAILKVGPAELLAEGAEVNIFTWG